MAKSTAKSLNVFIGCPGDMAPERAELLKLRGQLDRLGIPVRFLIWKDTTPGAGDPQEVIFDYFPIATWDIFIGLLWTRFGVPSGYKDPISGEMLTGTEAEFVGAYQAWENSGVKRPQVLLYRCMRDLPPDVDIEQLLGVRKFFKLTETGGQRAALAQDFKTPEELCRMVVPDIKTAAERLASAKKPSAPASPKKRTPKDLTPARDPGLELHRYFAGLRDQFSIYENVGLPVAERDGRQGEKDAPIAIRRLFVEPSCTEAHLSPEAVDALLREGKNPAAPLLPRLAPAKSRTVLLADPGMGKSTLIQWLISTLADEAVPPGAEALRGAIPFPFILRDLVGHLPSEVKGWNWDALVDAFRQWRHRGKGAPLAAPLTADDALFRSILASPGAFFLIDGLDEIGDPQRRTAIRDAIWEGFEKYPNARWLITSRVVGYEQAEVDSKWIIEWDAKEKLTPEVAKKMRQRLLDAGIPEDSKMPYGPGETEPTSVKLRLASLLHLAPFDDTQQLAFARNWYVPRLGDATGTQRADDFIAAVHRNDHTRVISRVPNLLYLLALLFRHRARLPDGRALVYAAISSAYLADIDLGRHLPDSLIVPWKFEEKEELLALVAMRMQEIRVARAKDAEDKLSGEGRFLEEEGGDPKDARGEILVNREQIEEWLGPRFGGAGDAEACAELHRFLDHIANRSGLLLPRGEGLFGFAHLSFQEYYAACFLEKEFQRILSEKAQPAGDDIFGAPAAAAKKDEEKMFAEMAALPAWREPLLFLVEKLRHSPPYTSRILGWTFPQLATEPPAAQEVDALDAVKKWMPLTAAQLLAGISLDQEVTLDDAQRAKIWRSLWQVHIAMFTDDVVYGGWNIAPSLIVTGSPSHTAVFAAVTALKPAKFHLFNCAAVSDLNLLAGMTCLKDLFLSHCTAVSDLKPLGGLASLTSLAIHGCTSVSDLRPLAGLTSLNGLYLIGCTSVSDLKPVAGLAFLARLNLSGCTAVSALTPLAGLASLQELYLDGCTAVTDEEVAALQASLPELKIIR